MLQAFVPFLSLPSPQGEKEGEKWRKSQVQQERQGLEPELVRVWGKVVNSEGQRGSAKHNTKKAVKITA